MSYRLFHSTFASNEQTTSRNENGSYATQAENCSPGVVKRVVELQQRRKKINILTFFAHDDDKDDVIMLGVI